MKVKSPNNTIKLQMGFNSAFKGLMWEEQMKFVTGLLNAQNVEIYR
jgi:hypothetical protein